MTKLKRHYSSKTLKILFAQSGNRCAYPNCHNSLVEQATEFSDTIVTGHICHIFAISEDGPRGKSELTDKELNSPENLILFCRHHHAIVDGQFETYPSSLLKEWKQKHELKFQKMHTQNKDNIKPDIFHYYPTNLVNQKIESEVSRLRKSRFFSEFDRKQFSIVFAKRLKNGEYSGGTNDIKRYALAWCIRILSTEDLKFAEEYYDYVQSLGTCEEIKIASAFIQSQRGEDKAALSSLATIDTPASRSASLMIMAKKEGYENALLWTQKVKIKFSDLDPDGKYYLLFLLNELSHWGRTFKYANEVTDKDLQEAPILYHMVAIAKLLSIVPNELRGNIYQSLPIQLKTFPLAFNEQSITTQREAIQYFINAKLSEKDLNCQKASLVDDKYALWLELRDPEQFKKGKQRLEELLRDNKTALHFTPFGIQFGFKLNIEKIEREIERQITLHGGITPDTIIARFALIFSHKKFDESANYIDQYFNELSEYYDKKMLKYFQFELFTKAGLFEKAKEVMDYLIKEGISEEEKKNLQDLINKSESSDLIKSKTELFKKSSSINDLSDLIEELKIKEDWESLCTYSRIMFDRTHSILDAELFANSLSKTHKYQPLINFLESNNYILEKSENLKVHYCWALINTGLLVKAKSESTKLNNQQDNMNYRILRVTIDLLMGNWNSLTIFVTEECAIRNKRSAQELISTAQLALKLGTPQIKELLFSAAEKGQDDANVLSMAYILAAKAGIEDNPEVTSWLTRAAQLSTNKGPIKKKSLKYIFNQKPKWENQVSEIYHYLERGEIPMFLVTQVLNTSLVDIMLSPALTNLSQNDLRRKAIIPAYSGKLHSITLCTPKIIGMDVSALLTLGFINLLGETFNAFETIYLPHSTLIWLLDEKGDSSFHQPNRIKDAHYIRDLLSTNYLEKLSPSTVPDEALSAQIGDGLALLIAEAEKERDDDTTQRIVVRSAPVHRLFSLMEEEADLSKHKMVLCSCMALVDVLHRKGIITSREEENISAYLQLHEKSWPYQLEINDGAVLYLDDLSVTFLLPFGIIEKLKTAGFRPIVSQNLISEIDKFILYESISGKVIDIINNIQSILYPLIESGKVKIGNQNPIGGMEDQPISRHPSRGIFTLAEHCEAIIIDDRFLNQHITLNNEASQVPIISTLDVLDILVSKGSIDTDKLLEARTLLRRAGYIFIPVIKNELERLLSISIVKNNEVIEPAELRAIRENILLVKMSNWLQISKEEPWLNNYLEIFIQTIKDLWENNTDHNKAEIYSDWLLKQIDILGWLHRLDNENVDGYSLSETRQGNHILKILLPPKESQESTKNNYWKWIEDRVLVPIKEQNPELYSWLVNWYKNQIVTIVDNNLIEKTFHD